MNCRRTSAIDAARLYSACRSQVPAVRNAAYQRLRHYLRVKLNTPKFALFLGKATAEEREDCLQEALEAIWLQLQRNSGPDAPTKFLAWATRILANKIVDWHRQSDERTKFKPADADQSVSLAQHTRKPGGGKRIPRHCLISLEALYEQGDEAGITYAERLSDPTAINPAQASERQENLYTLLIEIFNAATLNKGEIAVLQYGYLHEQSDHELAAQLHKSMITIRVMRKRALDKLRSNLHLQHEIRDFFTGTNF